ncbi:MAG TPA: hypothetical protein VKA41_04245 [Solirubrobacterales bacterium]|nr:hypothetical protein [Solirubrobacterales bacterium]
MAASRSTDLRSISRKLLTDLRGLGGNERIAVIGAAVMVGSLLLPWYESPISNDLVLTGIGAFSWAEGALVLIALATTFLALQGGGGYVPPRPLREWGLFVTAGSWAALIVLYRIADRPRFTLAGHDEPYDLHYAIFVALAGAVIIVIAGLRMRPRERAKRPRAPD